MLPSLSRWDFMCRVFLDGVNFNDCMDFCAELVSMVLADHQWYYNVYVWMMVLSGLQH